jgi:Cadherin-like/Cadherin-like domain
VGDLALTLTQGGTVALTTVDLRAVDPDNTACELVFTASNVQHGHLAFAVNPGSQITSFTEAQLEAGDVIFVHDGSNCAGSFSVQVTDGCLTSSTVTVNASLTQVESNLWGEVKFPSVVPGQHIFTPNVQFNSIGGFLAIGYAAALNYDPVSDPQGPYPRPQYVALTDPFLLPDQPAALQIASNTVTLPARMFTVTPNLNGTTPEAIVATVKQTNANGTGTDVIDRSIISQNSDGTLHQNDLGQVGSLATTGQTIFNLTESYRTSDNTSSGPLQTYDIAWDQYNSTTHTYQVYFQTFNADNSAAASVPVKVIDLSNVSVSGGEPVLPAFEFRSGFGGYALASTVSASGFSPATASLGLTGQTYQEIHFQGYNADGTLNSTLANFHDILPNLFAHSGATNSITQQVIPSLGAYPGQTAAQLQFVQASSANGNAVGVAWNETVTYTDVSGTHTYDQVEFVVDKSNTIVRPTVGGGTDPNGVAILTDAQNIRLDEYSDPYVSGRDDFVLVYGDDTGTHIKEYGVTTTNNVMSVTLLASAFDPTTHAFANMRALGDGRVVVTYDHQLAPDQTSQLDFKIFDLRTGPVTFNSHTGHDNYIAGTSFDGDHVTGEAGQNNTYYFVGGPTAPHDYFDGHDNSSHGWNTAILSEARSSYAINQSSTQNEAWDITNFGDPAHGGTLTIDGFVNALAFAPTEDPSPGSSGGVIHASGDELLILGNVGNSNDPRAFAIDGPATLEFAQGAGPVSANVSVTFNGAGGTLQLDQVSFNGVVHGFGANFIDFNFPGVSSDTLFRSYDSNHNVTSLSLGHDDVTDATIALAGDYTNTTFFVNDDGHGGGGAVIGTDHAPQASYVNVAIDATLVHAGTGMTIPGDLLAHFGTDPDPGDQLSLVSVDGSQTKGQVYETQSGDVVYTPPGSFVAPTGLVQAAGDQFSFTLQDSDGLTSTGHVALTAQGGTQIVGTTGHDLIMGASGDTLTGMGGDDVFVFQANFGSQTISDFHQGADQVDLSAFYVNQTQQQAAQALQQLIDATTAGSHALAVDASHTITFQGVDVHQLNATNDFILTHAHTVGA